MSGTAGAVAPWDVAAVLSVGPIWWLGGKAAQRARLPLITGYLLVRLFQHLPCMPTCPGEDIRASACNRNSGRFCHGNQKPNASSAARPLSCTLMRKLQAPLITSRCRADVEMGACRRACWWARRGWACCARRRWSD